MTRRRLVLSLTLSIACAVVAIASGQFATRAGDPLAGLTAQQFAEFRLGLDDFLEVETPDEGLGPAFNGTSCAACHNVPAVGGGGILLETRVGYKNADGSFRALNEAGDTLMHLFSTPRHACQSIMPADVTVVARRAPIPLFGAGLIEAIPDNTILALDDALDRNRDGISGRAAIVEDVTTGQPRVGRFGWKAQHATLLAFSGDAYLNEMGISNDLFPREYVFGVSSDQMKRCDPMPEPEDRRDRVTGRRGIDNFESFMRLLAPVERDSSTDPDHDGERIFSAIGCASCHAPSLTTGPSADRLFDRRTVGLFSDLLLHDVGTGDGIRQAAAAPEEVRTPALWGLRLRRPLLHDGSAPTPADAIMRHRNEAELARQGFERLSEADRGLLLNFLRGL